MSQNPIALLLREEALRFGYYATVALPLIVAGEIRGIFNLYAGENAFFDEQEMRLMDEMAGDISFAIEVAEQDKQRQNAEAAGWANFPTGARIVAMDAGAIGWKISGVP